MMICHLFLSVELIIIVALGYTLFGDLAAEMTRGEIWVADQLLKGRSDRRRRIKRTYIQLF